MENRKSHIVFKVEKGNLKKDEVQITSEIPLNIFVNDKYLMTIKTMPGDLHFLTIGFLKFHGFIESMEDLQKLMICDQKGVAQAQVRNPVPLRPQELETRLFSDRNIHQNMTSFPLKAFLKLRDSARTLKQRSFQDEKIHFAAAGDGESLFLYANDLEQHTAIDRLAGETLFKGIDLKEKVLLISGSISTSVVKNAARLGSAVVASLSAPTYEAVRLAEKIGMTLIGNLEKDDFQVYSCPGRIRLSTMQEKISSVTGVILAGGESKRMGSNKALLPFRKSRFIETIYEKMANVFSEVIIVTNDPQPYANIPCLKIQDTFAEGGPLAGIHAALSQSANDRVFVVGCDMPLVKEGLIRQVASMDGQFDVAVPETPKGLEPLHALYGKSCLPLIEECLQEGRKKVSSFFGSVTTKKLTQEDLAEFDPEFNSFQNINQPEDYFELRKKGLF